MNAPLSEALTLATTETRRARRRRTDASLVRRRLASQVSLAVAEDCSVPYTVTLTSISVHLIIRLWELRRSARVTQWLSQKKWPKFKNTPNPSPSKKNCRFFLDLPPPFFPYDS